MNIEPGLSRVGLQDMILDTKKMLAYYEAIKADCTSCQHRGPASKCYLHDAIVPEEFLTQGCDSWAFDDIPF